MSEYERYLAASGEYGVVEQITHPLALLSGLPSVRLGELVIFTTKQWGLVTQLKPEYVEVLLLSAEPVPLGTQATRTQTEPTITVGPHLGGSIINPLGEPLLPPPLPQAADQPTQRRPLEVHPPTIEYRTKITRPLLTGASVVDLLLPLSHGQRAIVMGDQNTGKTSFLLATMKAQAEHQIVVVYAAIGKRWSDLKKIQAFVQAEGKQNAVIVATSAHDAASLIYLNPFTAMTIAEYYRDQGRDVMVMLDDLSAHAQAYREIALLGKRFPGRDSYPGDMFHVHARLLERAGNYKKEAGGEASITCLAVAQTVESSFQSAIISNLISITDGHILFDRAIFNEGRHPAVDYTLSITRVGKQTQSRPARQLQQKLLALLAEHARAQRFTHFGGELSDELRSLLDTGDKLLEFFSQPLGTTIPGPVQLTLATMIYLRHLATVSREGVGGARQRLSARYLTDPSAKNLMDSLANAADLDALTKDVKAAHQSLLALCQPTSSVAK